ncbi:MAG TPA: nuclear transport factor 2 family protein [Nitrososphaera sp.]|jgi:predicted SnoaL-like aldol condensation-catalyzing enzyme|nr:nuclear transport factor 2 family protein [Nitrososphaera sp.]
MDTLEMNPKSNDANDGQNGSAKSAKEIVMEYLQALIERRDFKAARSYLKDNVSYVSPLNSFDGVEPYLKYNESLRLPKPDIKKIFTDGDDVCLLYEMTLTTQPEALFVVFWAHVDDGKISSIRLLFDPRPFIQPKR